MIWLFRIILEYLDVVITSAVKSLPGKNILIKYKELVASLMISLAVSLAANVVLGVKVVNLTIENDHLAAGVSKVNLLLDNKNPHSPLFSLLRLNNELMDKLGIINKENTELNHEIVSCSFDNKKLELDLLLSNKSRTELTRKLGVCLSSTDTKVLTIDENNKVIESGELKGSAAETALDLERKRPVQTTPDNSK